jgi:hypothetical protein
MKRLLKRILNLLNFCILPSIFYIVLIYIVKKFNLPLSEEYVFTIVMLSAMLDEIFDIEDKINKN